MPVFPPLPLDVPQAIRLHEVDAATTFIGKGKPGSGDSAAVWQIQRLTVVGMVILVEWAEGDDEFDNVWDDRASLSYS